MSEKQSATNYINEDSLKYVLSLPHGRKVLWDILSFGGLYHQPFTPESRRVTDFNCGRRDAAIVLLTECLTASAEHVALMMKEQANVTDNTDADDRGRDDRPSGDTDSLADALGRQDQDGGFDA